MTMQNKSHAFARDELIRTLSSYSGPTTADGNVGGTTLVCSSLIGSNDFIVNGAEKTILIVTGDAINEYRSAIIFDPLTGTITVASPFTDAAGLPCQILQGTVFRILNLSVIKTNSGLIYGGTITDIPAANQFTVPELAGLGDGKFTGPFAYKVFVFRDAGGLGAAPQSQMQWVTGYVSATGTFTHTPFTVALTVGDEVLILNPALTESSYIYYNTATANGALDGSTLIDTGLATLFTVDDAPIGKRVIIISSPTASLVGQERDIYEYDLGTTELAFDFPFTSQVPIGTAYAIYRGSPGGGGGPTPEPETEETAWKLDWYDNFDRVAVAHPIATEKWIGGYTSVKIADATANINTAPNLSKLYMNITAAAVIAVVEYVARAAWANTVRKFFAKVDASITVVNPNVNEVQAGLSISRGVAWDANNYIKIYKYQTNVPTEGIVVEYNLAGAGAIFTNVVNTTQDNIAFKIERTENVWRCYYSLTMSPRHRWVLGLEIEDAANSMTNQTSTYLDVYNPEDAVGQQISSVFDKFETYNTLGLLSDILGMVNINSGAIAYIGYCSPGMAASTTVIVCPNLVDFQNDVFNSGYQMIVLRNTNALGVAPEMEMRDITDYVSATGTFTAEAFSANVEASDIVLVIHNSVAAQISAYGIADAGSGVGIIRDAARTEVDHWWDGQTVMMLSGLARGQKRPIANFIAATDDIIPAPNFDAAVGAGDLYVILAHYNMIVPRVADGADNALTSDVVGRKDDAAVTVVGVIASMVAYIKGILNRVNLIFSIVNAIFTLKETGGTVTLDGTEQDVYRNETPMGVFKPKKVMINFTNQTAAEITVVREYYRITNGGNLILRDEVIFTGVQTIKLKSIELEPNRFGVQVTIQRTAGGAIAYNWEVFYED